MWSLLAASLLLFFDTENLHVYPAWVQLMTLVSRIVSGCGMNLVRMHWFTLQPVLAVRNQKCLFCIGLRLCRSEYASPLPTISRHSLRRNRPLKSLPVLRARPLDLDPSGFRCPRSDTSIAPYSDFAVFGENPRLLISRLSHVPCANQFG